MTDEMEQLAYKNRFVKTLVQDFSSFEASAMTPQVVSEGENLILLTVTLDEWKKLLSSVYTGADICYPDESDNVRWILLRAVEQPMDACAWLTNLIETCDDVREAITGVLNNAINNNPTTQDALENWLFSDTEVLNRLDERFAIPVLTPQNAAMNIMLAEACDPDFIFNQVTTLVDLLDALASDVHEAIEVGTNQFERWAILTSALPGVGQVIPADEGFAMVNQLVEELWEDYIGAYDASLRNDIRCEIFCLAQNDCTLSLDMVIAYYEGKVGGLSLEDPVALLNDIFSFIANGDFPGDLPVYIMHLLVLALIRAAQDVFGIDFTNMYLEVMAAGDTPNNDWETICPDCPVIGPWSLASAWVPDVPIGVIITNEENLVVVEATLGGVPELYRAVFQRTSNDCFIVASFDVGGATITAPGKSVCGSGVITSGTVAVSDELQVVSYASSVPFTATLTT